MPGHFSFFAGRVLIAFLKITQVRIFFFATTRGEIFYKNRDLMAFNFELSVKEGFSFEIIQS